MANLSVNSPRGFVASNSNIDVRGSSSALTVYDGTLSYVWNSIDYAASGRTASIFAQPDGTSILINLTTGSVELSGGKQIGGQLTYTRLKATIAGVSAEFILEGTIYFDTVSGNTSGEYTKVQYSNNSATTAFYGSIRETASGFYSGEITSIYERVSYSTYSYYMEKTLQLSSSSIGTSYGTGSFTRPIMSSSSAVVGATLSYFTNAGELIESQEYTNVNRTLLSDSSGNVFIGLMAGDDVIRLSGDGRGAAPSGFAGNDLIIGDAGSNNFYNKHEQAKGEYSGMGNDTIDGGGGYDTVYFGTNKSIAVYYFSSYDEKANSFRVVDNSGKSDNTGSDYLINIESLQFSDLSFVVSDFRNYLRLVSVENPNAGVFMYGSVNSDSFVGSQKGDKIVGNGGNDLITALGGDDVLDGGPGNDTLNGGDGFDTVEQRGNLREYVVRLTNGTGTISDRVSGRDGTDTISSIEAIRFADFEISTGVKAVSQSVSRATLDRVIELYVAFFNRIPDANGLSYWLTQAKAGTPISTIADTFYGAGVQYSSLTGFSAAMTNADFVNVIYRNVLGRKDGADAEGLAYWTGELSSGRASRGTLVNTILDSAHTFKGNATFGYVADLLDNKIAVAKQIAVDWGLNYLTADASITNGMAIAKAVTATDTSVAVALVGITPGSINLGG